MRECVIGAELRRSAQEDAVHRGKADGGKARAFQREDFVSGLQPMNGKMPPRLSVFFPATSAGIRPYAYDVPFISRRVDIL